MDIIFIQWWYYFSFPPGLGMILTVWKDVLTYHYSGVCDIVWKNLYLFICCYYAVNCIFSKFVMVCIQEDALLVPSEGTVYAQVVSSEMLQRWNRVSPVKVHTNGTQQVSLIHSHTLFFLHTSHSKVRITSQSSTRNSIKSA